MSACGALLLDAEAAHEAVAKLRGIPIGGGDGWLVVDARGDEGGTLLSERACDQLLERRLVERPIAPLDAGTTRDRHEIRAERARRGLRARDLIDGVVHHHDDQVLGLE